MFKIRMKTKSGNDIKKKEIFTIFFRLKFTKNALTKSVHCLYTYRIIHSKGITDCKCVLELKNSKEIKNIEDATLKVILNICHILTKISIKYNITPDFILFISPELNGKKNRSYIYLHHLFERKDDNVLSCEFIQSYDVKFEEFKMLQDFVESNNNCSFRNIDPGYSKKYTKSLEICNQIWERFNNLNVKDDKNTKQLESELDDIIKM